MTLLMFRSNNKIIISTTKNNKSALSLVILFYDERALPGAFIIFWFQFV